MLYLISQYLIVESDAPVDTRVDRPFLRNNKLVTVAVKAKDYRLISK